MGFWVDICGVEEWDYNLMGVKLQAVRATFHPRTNFYKTRQKNSQQLDFFSSFYNNQNFTGICIDIKLGAHKIIIYGAVSEKSLYKIIGYVIISVGGQNDYDKQAIHIRC